MTIQVERRFKKHVGNSAATEFDYDFLIPDEDSARVYLYDTVALTKTLLNPSLYSITGLGDSAGGEVTYPLSGAAITSAYWLIIERAAPYTQNLDINNQGFFPETIEQQLDNIVMQIQQLREEQSRIPTLLVEGETFTTNAGHKAALAGRFLVFGADGEPLPGPLLASVSNVGLDIASNAEADAGVADDRAMTPAKTSRTILNRGYDRREGSLEYFAGQADVDWTPGVTQMDDVLDTMFGALDTGDVKSLSFPPNVVLVSDEYSAPAIGELLADEDSFSIRGYAGASIIRFEAGAGTGSTLFKVGTGAAFGIRIGIEDLIVEHENTPDPAAPLFDLVRASEVYIRNVTGKGLGKILKTTLVGTVTLRDCVLANLNAADNAGSVESTFEILDAALVRLLSNTYSDTTKVGNGAAAGKFIHVKSASGSASIDTLILFDNQFQLFDGASVNADLDGRPYGLYIERPNPGTASVANLWVNNNSFDATSVAGIYAEQAAGNTAFATFWQLDGNHMLTAAGKGIVINNDGTQRMAGVDITRNAISIVDNNPGLDLDLGSGTRAVTVAKNKVLDRWNAAGTTIAKSSAAIKVGGTGFSVIDNEIDNHTGQTPGWNIAIEVTDVATDHCVIRGNNAPRIRRHLKEPVYTVASANRRIMRPWEELIGTPNFFYRDYDFDDNALPATWLATLIGTDAQVVAPAIIANGQTGQGRMTTGDDGGATMDLNGVSLVYAQKCLRCVEGGIIIAGRFAINASTAVAVFFGLHDNNATRSMPFTLAGTVLTSNAVDGVGFLLDTDATVDNIKLVGVKNNVDTTVQDTGVAIDTNYHSYRIEINSAGSAVFYLDGVPVGVDMDNAITGTTLLAPYLGGFSRVNQTRQITFDRIRFGCFRAVPAS